MHPLGDIREPSKIRRPRAAATPPIGVFNVDNMTGSEPGPTLPDPALYTGYTVTLYCPTAEDRHRRTRYLILCMRLITWLYVNELPSRKHRRLYT